MKVNYEKAEENHVRSDAEKALKIILSGEEGTSLVIFPQALNPLLKALESIDAWKQVVILPYSDDNGKPLYIVYKIGQKTIVDEISVKGV